MARVSGVCVHACDVVAACRAQPDVEARGRLARRVVEDPDAGVRGGELLQDRPRAVAGAPVDEDEFGVVRDVLRLQRRDRVADVELLVEHRCQRADKDAAADVAGHDRQPNIRRLRITRDGAGGLALGFMWPLEPQLLRSARPHGGLDGGARGHSV